MMMSKAAEPTPVTRNQWTVLLGTTVVMFAVAMQPETLSQLAAGNSTQGYLLSVAYAAYFGIAAGLALRALDSYRGRRQR